MPNPPEEIYFLMMKVNFECQIFTPTIYSFAMMHLERRLTRLNDRVLRSWINGINVAMKRVPLGNFKARHKYKDRSIYFRFHLGNKMQRITRKSLRSASQVTRFL